MAKTMLSNSFKKQRSLEAAMAGCRAALPEERLSNAARERILNSALRNLAQTPRVPEPVAPLFTPLRRLIWTTALPVAALVVMFGALLVPHAHQARQGEQAQQTRLTVSKIGGEVRFEISNEHRVHRVYRMTTPGAKDVAPFQTARGSFTDNLASGADLVFYRVE